MVNYVGVAISGRAGSGKSTLAGTLQREWIPTCTITPFAHFLKEEVWELYGIRKGDPGSREMLIKHGSIRRTQDPLYWVKLTGMWIEEVLADGGIPVVDDLRFPNEYEWLRQRGFLLVHLHAPLHVRKGRLASQGLDPNFAYTSSISEVALEQHGFHLRLPHGGHYERRLAVQAVASRLGLSSRAPKLRKPVHPVPDAVA